KRRLNVRLVASVFFAGVVVSVAVHFLHAFQVRRYATGLLYQAERAEQEGQYRQAINYLNRYTILVPDNAAAQAKLGLLMADYSSRMRAFHVLERAVRLDPANQKARRRLVQVAMNLERFIDAREHIEKYLLKSAPEDAELENLLGQCYIVGASETDARM